MATPILTKDRVLIGLDKMPGDWDTCSDPGSSRESTPLRRSADGAIENVNGRLTFEDITLTRFWDEARDGAIVRQWHAAQGVLNDVTLSLTSIGSDGVPMGAPRMFAGSVKSVASTGSDANSTDPAKLTVVLSIARAA